MTICFVLSNDSKALAAWSLIGVNRPVYFYPEERLSQAEQVTRASEKVVEWANYTGEVCVVTHSVHFIDAARLALIAETIKPAQVRAIFLVKEDDQEIRAQLISFDELGGSSSWPTPFMSEDLNGAREIVKNRAVKRRAMAEADRLIPPTEKELLSD